MPLLKIVFLHSTLLPQTIKMQVQNMYYYTREWEEGEEGMGRGCGGGIYKQLQLHVNVIIVDMEYI